jgi:hypothetical protein
VRVKPTERGFDFLSDMPRVAVAQGGRQRVDRCGRPQVLEGLHHAPHDQLLVVGPFLQPRRAQHALQRGDQVQLELFRLRVRGHQRGDRHVRRRVHGDQVPDFPLERFDFLFHG